MEKVSILWALVRRDYALQYAGSFLGISWMFLQNLVLISLYALVFLVLNLKNPSTQEDFTDYLLTGLLFLIPKNYWFAGQGFSRTTDLSSNDRVWA
jgi:lipopolysaccharide transport system permease protein